MNAKELTFCFTVVLVIFLLVTETTQAQGVLTVFTKDKSCLRRDVKEEIIKEIRQRLDILSTKSECCESGCCPPRWDKHGDSCYYVEKNGTSKWQDARIKCQNMGADLAIITSSHENRFIANLTKKYKITSGLGIWFGLQRLADDKFYWIDGTPLASHFQGWKQGQPDNYGGIEDCGHMRGLVDQPPGQWNDLTCSLAANYAPYPGLICEKSISYF
ncbi:C-type lectin domain family 10 member A-like isoform X1 [Acropora millepora]|uniref:C-type lectin domain family 10 member A-like isoform X1 n=1 Tax=Acropora millepora TaxID=45264 RepID=UPI001CF2D09F|nr:C-type lectin domain family 10 member A-like isoform X1 [Acropora millepora]